MNGRCRANQVMLLCLLGGCLSIGGSALAQPATAGPDYSRMTGYHLSNWSSSEEPHVLWKFLSRARLGQDLSVHMESLSDVVVGNEALYFVEGGDPARVFSLNRTTGMPIWRYEHCIAGFNGNPSIDEKHVYFGSSIGVTALRRSDGELVWHYTLPSGMGEGVPLPVQGRLYFSGYDGCSYALNCDNGELIWKHSFVEDAPSDKKGFAAELARIGNQLARPRGAACDGDVFLQSVFDQSRLVAIRCDDGSRAWTFDASGWIGPAATIHEDHVYFCSQDEQLYCLNRQTGELEWKFSAPTWLASRVAVHRERVYLPVHGGRIYQLDASSGEQLGVFEPSDAERDQYGLVYTFPIVTEDQLFVSTGKGSIICLDIEHLTRQWDFMPSPGSELFTTPATDGRRIYLSSRQGARNAGECSILAVGFADVNGPVLDKPRGLAGNDRRQIEVRSADGSVNSLQQDLALIHQAGQKGAAGALYFVEATNDLLVLFPKSAPAWDVVEQVRQAVNRRQKIVDNRLKEVIEAAKLTESQANQLRIAYSRDKQQLLRNIRSQSDALRNVSWKQYSSDGERVLQDGVVVQRSKLALDPFASGGAIYEAIPTTIANDQKRLLIDHFLATSNKSFRIFQFTEDQAQEFRKVLSECADNPLDLRPENHQQLFRNLYLANRRRVQVFMDDNQYAMFEELAK